MPLSGDTPSVDLRRDAVAVGLEAAALELVGVIARGADDAEDAAEAQFILDEAAGQAALPRGREGRAEATGRIGRLDVVLGRVDAGREGVADEAGLEARGVEDVEAARLDVEGAHRAGPDAEAREGRGRLRHPLLVGGRRDIALGGEIEPRHVGTLEAVADRVGAGVDVVAEARTGAGAAVIDEVVALALAREAERVAVGWTQVELAEAADQLAVGVRHRHAGPVAVAADVPIDELAEHVGRRADARAGRRAGEEARAVGDDADLLADAVALVRGEDVVDRRGAEQDNAADGARAVDGRDRAARDVDAADEFGIEEEAPVGAVSRGLEILPGAVDEHVDPPEILQAANVDRLRGVVVVLRRRHAGHVAHRAGNRGRLDPVDVVAGHHGGAGERVDGTLFGLGRGDGDGVERHLLRQRGAGGERGKGNGCGKRRMAVNTHGEKPPVS